MCPAGTYNDVEGATDEFFCLMCPMGHYCPESGNTSATVCEVGWYADFIGSTECYECPSGYYCADGLVPVICAEGTYNNLTG